MGQSSATPSRVRTRIVRGVHHGGAADGVEVHHLDGGVVVIDRVIAGALADVRAGGIVAEHAGLVVAAVGGVVGLLHPVALFQAEDAHLGFGEAPGDGGTRGAGADDQDVDLFVHVCLFGYTLPVIARTVGTKQFRSI